MDFEILQELTRSEWELEEEIVHELLKHTSPKSLNFFPTLYPNSLDGTILYLAETKIDAFLFDFLTRISDSVIVPIVPMKKKETFESNYCNFEHFLQLWDAEKVLPMFTFLYENYVGADFLDPLLENQPVCGAIRSNILLRLLFGAVYDEKSNDEKKFTKFMFGSEKSKTSAASILTELQLFGLNNIVYETKKIMLGNFASGYLFSNLVARTTTVPIVSGFGGIPQFTNLITEFQETLPWRAKKKHCLVDGKALHKKFDPKKIDETLVKELLLELDANCKTGINESISKSLTEIDNALEKGDESLDLEIYLSKSMSIGTLTWHYLPLLSWNSKEKQSLQNKIPIKEIRAGDPVVHPSGMKGTLGGFALDVKGNITKFTAKHVTTGGYTSDDSIIFYGLQQEGIENIFYNLRIRNLDEDLPAVLKRPAKPKRNLKLIMSGWKGGIIKGKVMNEKLKNKPYYFTTAGNTFPVNGKTLFTAKMEVQPGDSGALILSEEGRFPIGLVVASSVENPEITYCHRLIDVFPRNKILGIFSPIGIPEESSSLCRQIVESMVPDGLFIQGKNIMKKTEQEIRSELGDASMQEKSKKQKKRKNNKTIAIGDKIRRSGPLVLNDLGEIVGIAFASSGNYSVVQTLDRIENALSMKLISTVLKKKNWKEKMKTFFPKMM